MPRLLTKDAHEWINEIPTVPGYYPANQQSKGNGLEVFSGEDPVEFDSNLDLCSDIRGVG